MKAIDGWTNLVRVTDQSCQAVDWAGLMDIVCEVFCDV